MQASTRLPIKYSKLAELYPIMVQMEKYAGGKHTRVVRVFRTDEKWKDGT